MRITDGGQVFPLVASGTHLSLDGIRFPAASGSWVGIGPFGPPVWDMTEQGLIRIRYIAGLSPLTKYDLTFEVE